MSFFGAAASSSSSTITPATADKDIEVADPPTDSISSISFSSAADYLAVGSWDNNVSVYIALLYARNRVQTYFLLGPYIRGGGEWADTGKGDVLTPGASPGCMLEQGAYLSKYFFFSR